MLFFFVTVVAAGHAYSHCEIPCGIYDDEMRIALIREHIDTIEKSMKMIEHLKSEEELNYNQIVRWINNKELHADELQHIVSQYFMTQRIKPAEAGGDQSSDELKKLALLHSLLVAAMKSKQEVNLDHISRMRDIVDRFEKLYFTEE